ncbi:lmo0937 family membrane protein [Terrimonas alba]|uniref:lmo0937 family membrane protein n=1 Tax=Terrimonas alba TaxID=3349636 RepID=UPI0035F36C8F
MTNLLYIMAVILIIGWLLGFFVFNAGGFIHVLLVIAVIAILARIIQGRKVL